MFFELMAAASFAGFFTEANAIWSLILLAAGIVLMVVEMLTPGVGVAFILGSASLIASVFVRSSNLTYTLITVAIILVIMIISGLIVFRSFNKGKLSKSAILLNDTIEGQSTSISSDKVKELVGKVGVTISELRPVGVAVIDNERFDVTTRGEFIKKDSEIEVIRVEGLKIVVKSTQE